MKTIARKRMTVDVIIRKQISLREGMRVRCRIEGETRFGTLELMEAHCAWVRVDGESGVLRRAWWETVRPVGTVDRFLAN